MLGREIKRTIKHKGKRFHSDHRHATKLFRGYHGTKSAGSCINAEKMRGWGNAKGGRWEREENEKRSKREKLRAGGKERRARLAAGGSNCVINLKVRFSRERERTGGEKGRGTKGEEEERERARDIRMLPVGLCRGVRVFFRGTVYTCETTARIRNCR